MTFTYGVFLYRRSPESRCTSVISSIYADMVFGKTDVLEVGPVDVLYTNIVSVARTWGKF